MKSIFKIAAFLTLFFPLTSLWAQGGRSIYGEKLARLVENHDFPEKLTFLFNEEVKVVIESKEILNIPQGQTQKALIRNLLSDMGKVEDSLSTLKAPLIIIYSALDDHRRKLNVAFKSDTKAEFIFTGNSDTVSSGFFNYRIECPLDNNNRLILLTNHLSSLSTLQEASLSDYIQQVKGDLLAQKISRNSAKSCIYKISNNKLDIAHAEIKKERLVVIVPSMGFGISYLNDRFLSNVSGSIGYVISQKRMNLSMVGLSCEAFANMDPKIAYNIQGNVFVDAFLHIKQPSHPFYYARDTKIFCGFLVGRQGEVFPKNAWRIGLDMPAGEHFRIEYVVYSSNYTGDGNSAVKGGLFEVGLKYRFF